MKTVLTAVLAIALVPAICNAQYAQVTIPGTQVRTLTSKVVNGQEYELDIMLPANFDGNTKQYPVVYLMDSQWDFPLLKCLYGEHYYDGFIPELIVVGVTWGGDHPNPDSLRARDYTPTREARAPQSGGAEAFLSFMKTELFPFIESNYRGDPNKRILMGCSLGGLFTLYTLFTHPDMFNGYAAASPAIGWDNGVLSKFEKEFAEKKLDTPKRIYMTVGDVELGKPGFEQFAALMTSRHYPSIILQSKVLENTGHSGTKSETYARGLQFVFEKPKVKLNANILNRYTGHYEGPGGLQFDLRMDNGQFTFFYSPTAKIPLLAASENHFYSNSQFFNLYFTGVDANAITVRFERYNNIQHFKKIN